MGSKAPAQPPSRDSVAVVIGGAFAGLASAGWLSELFDKVLVLERDAVPTEQADALRLLEELSTPGVSAQAAADEASRRKGVPHFLHCHGWLAGGLASLERLFPGFTKDTVRFGALLPSKGKAWTISGTSMVKLPPKASSSFQGLQGTRALHEGVLRWRLLKDARNVTIRAQAVVEGLLTGPDNAIAGVRLASGEEVTADLVVDCSGHRAHAKHWLQASGFTSPKEEIVNQRSAWTTRFYSLPAQVQAQLPYLRLFNRPAFPGRRGAVFMRVEGEKWMLCHNGLNGDHSANDVESFDAFTKSLATPDIWQVVQDSKPLNNPYTYKGAANAMRRYHRWKGPERFCVVGDAFCVLNPRFGNGMTVAALMAERLALCLMAHLADAESRTPSPETLKGFSTMYHKSAGHLAEFPFTLITSWDLMYGGTVGERRRGILQSLWGWYVSLIREISDRDAEAWQALEGVIQMMKPPGVLRGGSLMAKVALHVLQKLVWQPAQRWVMVLWPAAVKH